MLLPHSVPTGLIDIPTLLFALSWYTALCLHLVQHCAVMLLFSVEHSNIRQSNSIMNIVRLLHLEWSIPNPLSDFKLKFVLKEICRDLGSVCDKQEIAD